MHFLAVKKVVLKGDPHLIFLVDKDYHLILSYENSQVAESFITNLSNFYSSLAFSCTRSLSHNDLRHIHSCATMTLQICRVYKAPLTKT